MKELTSFVDILNKKYTTVSVFQYDITGDGVWGEVGLLSLCSNHIFEAPTAHHIKTNHFTVSYLTPMVHCRKVHTPHMKRKVDMISAVTSSRSPAQM